MDPSKIIAYLLLFGLFFLMPTSTAYEFDVGGRTGWTLNPSEPYNHWAERMRFQVNDSLVFRYKKGEDSVLLVKPEDYNTCNVSSPLLKLDGGVSVFGFRLSGPFYFISGADGHCEKGQRMIVVVMAIRNKKSPPPASQPPSPPAAPSPTPVPPSLSPAPTPPSEAPSRRSSSSTLSVSGVSFGLAAVVLAAAFLN